MNIIEGEEFQKEFKKLAKKYRTLEQDFVFAKNVITDKPLGDGTKHWNLLKQVDAVSVFKTRMMCRSLRGADFRLIYIYNGVTIEVLFIEVYFKGDKSREDQKRIDDIIRGLQ